MKTKENLLLIIVLILSACHSEVNHFKAKAIAPIEPTLSPSLAVIDSSLASNSLVERFPPPKGYTRIPLSEKSFGNHLRYLPLKPPGTLVQYYNGQFKKNNHIYEAVVDLAIGNKNLHQCADAIMRLRGEYLWQQKKYDQIHFNFTNGFKVNYTEWMKGKRIVVKGNETYWNNRFQPSNEYQDFWSYMEVIFMYAGTASLEKELKPVALKEMKVGDVLIQGGYPGHAVIVMDMSINQQTGEKAYILGQSYMPAQELQILTNPNDPVKSPWYSLEAQPIITPEWTFEREDLKRFGK